MTIPVTEALNPSVTRSKSAHSDHGDIRTANVVRLSGGHPPLFGSLPRAVRSKRLLGMPRWPAAGKRIREPTRDDGSDGSILRQTAAALTGRPGQTISG